MTDPEEQLVRVLDAVDTTDKRLERSDLFLAVSQYVVSGYREYLALPITVSVVLIVSNILAAAGSVFSHPLLLLPWLTLYLLVNVFVSCLLVYVMILLQDAWFQVCLLKIFMNNN